MTDLLGKRAREIVDEAVDKAPNANQFIARSSAIGAVRHAVEEERERCAKIAEAHIGQAARDRDAKAIKNVHLSDEAWAEIHAEERGETIASEIIAKNIRAAIAKATATP